MRFFRVVMRFFRMVMHMLLRPSERRQQQKRHTNRDFQQTGQGGFRGVTSVAAYLHGPPP
jgi:hypothetical protein